MLLYVPAACDTEAGAATGHLIHVRAVAVPLKWREKTEAHSEADDARRQARNERIQQGRLLADTQSYSLELNTGFVVSIAARKSVV